MQRSLVEAVSSLDDQDTDDRSLHFGLLHIRVAILVAMCAEALLVSKPGTGVVCSQWAWWGLLVSRAFLDGCANMHRLMVAHT